MDQGSRRRRVVVAFVAALALLSAAGAFAATIAVTSAADVVANDGVCTFREAIISANTNAASGPAGGECGAGDPGNAGAADVIAFNIPGAGPHVITVSGALGALPHITEKVTIDGFTQPGSSANSNPYPGALNAVLKIELDVHNSPSLVVDNGPVIIRGIAIHGSFGAAIEINADDVVVVGCYIGTDASGNAALPFNNYGIRVNGSHHRTKIGYSGAPLTPDRNLITNYDTGGIVSSGGTDPGGGPDMNIIGNFIGTNVNGTASLVVPGNGAVGMTIANVVVNTTLVSGNEGGGILVTAPGNAVIFGSCADPTSGNLIGVQRDAVTPLPNGGFGGVKFLGGNSTLGGGPCNLIAYNNGMGVTVPPGVTGVRIIQNFIHHNTAGGISLTGTSVPLPNDPCDADTAPGNHGQNYPVITSVTISPSSIATVIGTIEGKANTTYVIELFSSASCDASGHGQGANYINHASVVTDASCTTNFNIQGAVPPGDTVFTATATDTSTDPAHWETSEFSACFPPAGTSFYPLTPCRVIDTRDPAGPYGGPALAANVDRTFVIQGQCGVPVGARAAAFNLAVTLSTAGGDLRVVPAGGALPLVSALNWNAGQTRANNAIIQLGAGGDVTVHPDQPSGTVHLIVDITGYFQ
jgi:hypothetical protein